MSTLAASPSPPAPPHPPALRVARPGIRAARLRSPATGASQASAAAPGHAQPVDSGLRLLIARGQPLSLRWTLDGDAPANRALAPGECRLAVLALQVPASLTAGRMLASGSCSSGSRWVDLRLPGWACVIEASPLPARSGAAGSVAAASDAAACSVAAAWPLGALLFGTLPLGTHAVLEASSGRAAGLTERPWAEVESWLPGEQVRRGPDAVEATLEALWRDASHGRAAASQTGEGRRASSPTAQLPILVSAWMRSPWPTRPPRSSPRHGAT